MNERTLIPVSTVGPMLVTKSALAKELSVSERTIDSWRSRRVIPFLQFGERFVRFDLAEVRAALEQRYRLQAKTKLNDERTSPKKNAPVEPRGVAQNR